MIAEQEFAAFSLTWIACAYDTPGLSFDVGLFLMPFLSSKEAEHFL